jgi:hemolysin activation/secretion protein
LFDWRDVITTNNLPDNREDNIRAVRVGARYDFLDTFIGVGANAFDIEFAKGLGIFGASDEGDADLTRPSGDPEFFKINAEVQRLQRVTGSVNLLIAVQGQWANDALLASEEFGVGGINIGRAYDSSEIVGDEGVAAKVEVQWNKPVQWNLVQDYEVFGFFDAGKVWNKDATTADLKDESATSTGFGLRTEFMDKVNADVTVAFPLNRDIATQNDDDPRVYFSVTKQF